MILRIFFLAPPRYPGFEEYVNENFLPDSVKLPEGASNISDSFFRQVSALTIVFFASDDAVTQVSFIGLTPVADYDLK